MKLKKFTAKNVYGYLKFDIDFYNDLSFLVGVNGSGKTTMLRLMQALLTPSFRDLLSIPFSEASVIFDDKGIMTEINSIKSDDKVELKVSTIEETLLLSKMLPDELDYIVAHRERSDEVFEELQIKYSDNKVFQYISKINAPVFLGLERTHKSNLEVSGDFYYERERLITKAAQRGLRAKRIIKGSLAAGLTETQLLVQETYRQLRRRENTLSERLKEDILLSSFKPSDFSFLETDLTTLKPSMSEKSEFLERKQELAIALTNIGLSEEKIKKVLDEFFNRLQDLFKSMENAGDSKGIPLHWILNKAQIDRVADLIKIIDDHKSKVDKIFAAINTFIEIMNSFYKDTEKLLTIDTVGQLGIQRPDRKTASIDALSSGERQLLIIFAHLLFNEYGTRSNVFIIDEPELSLHLSWQEQFVAKALEVSPNTQLILATHSPEIIGDYDNKSINI